MGIIGFEVDWKALWTVFILSAAVYWLISCRKDSRTPFIYFSSLSSFKLLPKSIKARGAYLPKRLEYITLVFFLLAFIDPRIFLPRPISPEEIPNSEATEGIAIYFLLDQSGSMAETIAGRATQGKTKSKIDLLKELTRDFIQGNPAENLAGRPNDLLGLIAFARVPNVLSPLTLDHQSILKKLNEINVVSNKNYDGTGIGYAIYKTANLIAAIRHFSDDLPEGKSKPYDIKSTIMILVTDGVQEINPLDRGNALRTIDIAQAADYAKQQGIRLYIVNIEPQISNEEFAPFRHQMQKAAETTGGKFFMMNDPAELGNVYSDIDHLEKSKLPNNEDWLAQVSQSISKDKLPHFFYRFPLYPFFIGAGMICLFVSIILNSTWMRRLP